MKLAGILSVSNARGFNYPYISVAKNLLGLCDEVIVGVDPNFPQDCKELETEIPQAKLVYSPWNLQLKSGGREIATQMDKLVGMTDADWVVVLQADEFIHEGCFSDIRYLLNSAMPAVTGFSMERLYFWKDLETIRSDWQARLVRMFRPGTYSFLADNTDKAGMYSGQTKFGLEIDLDDPFYIYHYSRVGEADIISKRVRNLDTFFHPEEELVKPSELPAYDFISRKYDNYSIIDKPPQVEGLFTRFTGTHPSQVISYYGAK